MDMKVFSANLLEFFYILTGLIMVMSAVFIIKDDKHPAKTGSAAFWAILGFIFMTGKYAGKGIPYWLIGILIVIMGALTLTKQVKLGTVNNASDSFRQEQAKKIGGKIFVPSLALALVAFGVAQYLPKLGGLNAIGISGVVGIILAVIITKTPAKNIAVDGDRLLQQVGAASILPQLLGALGAVFTAAGVGNVISKGISGVIPQGNILAGVIAYCVGMALFTMIMGNAFAAFAVITAGIGIPFVFAQGANPAIAGILALTAGYCGTLLTPMAANFNVVPAALLETKNKNRVIIAQAPIALTLLAVHIVLMYVLAF
jgi:uncharacterized membrane protein